MKQVLSRDPIVILVYLAIINAIFLQLPICGSLPGNVDSWANLSMFKDMGNHILNLFQHQPLGSSNYPCSNIWPLYGLDFFSGVIFLFFKLFGLSDIWAYDLYITTIFALNSFSVYKLCSLYSSSRSGCFLAGLFFSISNFVLGNIDNPNIVLTFPGFLGVYFLIRAVRLGSIKDISFVFISFSFQLLLAPVSCLMFSFVCLPYVLFHIQSLFSVIRRNVTQLLVPIAILAIALVPYIYFYVIIKIPTHEFNMIRKMEVVPYFSMSLNDFFRTLPNNLLFHTNQLDWLYLIKSGYTGFALISVASIGAWRFRNTGYPLFIFIMGLMLSMGPYFTFHDHTLFASPVLLLYKLLPISDYLRVPSRFFILGLAGMVILFSIGWEKLIQYKSPIIRAFVFTVPLLYIIENLPFPMKSYASHLVYDNGSKAQDYIRRSKFTNVLNLPSRLFENIDQREYIYMCYQAMNRKNTVNGSLAYIPALRLKSDSLCKKAVQIDELDELITEYSIDVIMFHSDLAQPSEMGILKTLKSDSSLLPIDTSGPKKTFEVLSR